MIFLCLLFLFITAAHAQLYGMSGSAQLVRFKSDGTATPIGPARPSELQAQNLAALDSVKGIYYYVGFVEGAGSPNLLGISIADGAVVTSVALPFAEMVFVGVGQLLAWAPDLGLAVLTGQSVDQTHLIGTVNVTSGAWRQVAKISRADDDVLGGSCAYVPGGTFIFNLGVKNGTVIDNFSVDLSSGQVRSADNTARRNIVSMSFNALDGMIYGLGLHIVGNGWTRSIVRMNPATLAITEMGLVTDYGIESGGIGTVDAAAKSLYWIGMAAPYVPNSPFFLIQSSIVDGSTISAAFLCDNDAVLPWSLEYRA
jgi:hypothetical protein